MQEQEPRSPAMNTDEEDEFTTNGVARSESEMEKEQGHHEANCAIKLFVGQVPRSMEEDELRPVMERFGELYDIVVIRDKSNGQHRGCAFVTYASRDSAEQAIAQLHNIVVLPPSTNPLQVRPAEGQPTVAATQEHKLFIGMLPKTADEDAIRQMFLPFGNIEEVYILRHPSTNQSKGCAFLKFSDRRSAQAAIEEVHGKVVMEGGSTSLVVKFADNRRQRMQRQRTQAANAAATYWQTAPPPGANIAFPQVQQQYIQQMQMFGSQVPPPPPGQARNFTYYSPCIYGYGYSQPQPYNPAFGAPPACRNLSSNDSHAIATATAAGTVVTVGGPLSGPKPTTSVGLPAVMNPASPILPSAGKQHRSNPQQEGPEGANLFIYHLPHDLTDADLATAFAPFGTVISAKVYMDKNTGESKGFGFVSYNSVQAAEAAITSMNGFQIGSKRLKVQHKRVHREEDATDAGSNSSSEGASSADYRANDYTDATAVIVDGTGMDGADSDTKSLDQSVRSMLLEGD